MYNDQRRQREECAHDAKSCIKEDVLVKINELDWQEAYHVAGFKRIEESLLEQEG
jgi:hypothetical protein